ncbi:MAG: hypothetical protein U1E22_06225, partial [Coriobacteriia bacterium]|nr:hypothetical protein [Coriobacteriia bacterium]
RGQTLAFAKVLQPVHEQLMTRLGQPVLPALGAGAGIDPLGDHGALFFEPPECPIEATGIDTDRTANHILHGSNEIVAVVLRTDESGK